MCASCGCDPSASVRRERRPASLRMCICYLASSEVPEVRAANARCHRMPESPGRGARDVTRHRPRRAGTAAKAERRMKRSGVSRPPQGSKNIYFPFLARTLNRHAPARGRCRSAPLLPHPSTRNVPHIVKTLPRLGANVRPCTLHPPAEPSVDGVVVVEGSVDGEDEEAPPR